jgi:hypothetical protein
MLIPNSTGAVSDAIVLYDGITSLEKPNYKKLLYLPAHKQWDKNILF